MSYIKTNTNKQEIWHKLCAFFRLLREIFNMKRTVLSLEVCLKDASQYQHKNDWQKGKASTYRAAKRNGWFDQCTAHMTQKSKWSLEACLKDASQYQYSYDWQKGNRNAYYAAQRKGWLDQCTEHMLSKSNTWTLEACLKDASQYQHKSDWQKGNANAYCAAHRNGWLDQCTAHMTKKTRQTFWSLEACLRDASQYQHKWDWQKGNASAYGSAHRNGWLDQCTKHMTRKTRQLLSS